MKEDFQDFFSNSILKFESMIKSNKFLFFDVDEFESIIIYYLESGNTSLLNKALKMALKQYPNNSSILLLKVEALIIDNKIKEAQKLIDQLPNGYKVVFNLYAIEGYKHSEIAEMLGISESTSKSQLFKARKWLQTSYLKMNKLENEER